MNNNQPLNLLSIENKSIEECIYNIRGQQVMLDSDLARLYKCKNGTKAINQAVNRNIERFPKDFYFQLTEKEYNNLKFQIETSSSKNNYGGVRKLPYVFTEQGVAMLATVLRTEVASKMSVAIMRAFVVMRKYISSNLIQQKYINNQVLKNTEEIIKYFSLFFRWLETIYVIIERIFEQINCLFCVIFTLLRCGKIFN